MEEGTEAEGEGIVKAEIRERVGELSEPLTAAEVRSHGLDDGTLLQRRYRVQSNVRAQR